MRSRSPCDLDVVVGGFGHQELARDLHLGRLRREVAQEATLFLNEEELGQLLRLCLQDLYPLLQLGDQIVELHGAGHAEVKVWRRGQKENDAMTRKPLLMPHLLPCRLLIRDVHNESIIYLIFH